MKSVILRSAVVIAAVVGLATPASAAVDLDVKRSIVEVVLDNLGVSASPEFIVSIAQDLVASELDSGLVTAVNNILDTNADPRSIIESQTDANGDGVPDEGAALEAADDDSSDDEDSTKPSNNSGSNSGSNSGKNSGSSSNSNSNSNSGNGGGSDDGSDDESDDESDDNSGSDDGEDESEDEDD